MKLNSRTVLAGLGVLMVARKVWREVDKHHRGFRNKVVLITGGSRGFGLAMARQFAKEGAKLALLARDERELATAAEELRQSGGEVLTLIADVRDPDSAGIAIRQVLEHYSRLDVVVNNAGMIVVGPMENMQRADYEDALATHFWGPMNFMLAAIPHLKETKGRIVNISSIGGKVAIPHLAPYSVSKFALSALSDSFRAELSRIGISVTTVLPGLLRSGSHIQAIFKGQHEKEFAWFALGAATPLTSISVVRAATQVIEACRKRRTELVISWQAKLAILAHALFPRLTAVNAAAIANRLPASSEAGNVRLKGFAARGAFPPRWATALNDKASAENNELHQAEIQ